MYTSVIKINSNKPIVIIDFSFYIFNRYYATYKWFSFRNKQIDHENITEDKEFLTAIIKHFEADIKKIIKKFKTTTDNMIICMDCPRSEIWRNDIYAEYKASRVQKKNFNGAIFKYINDYITEQKKIKQVIFDRLEADDIVYLLQKEIKNKVGQEIIIITNDNDYLQLADNNVKIINMQFKDIVQRGLKDRKKDLLLKVIYGDKSDNIPKICYGLTKEKALNLITQSEDEINKYLVDNKLLEKFNLNMKLVCLNQIPEELSKKFYEYYNISII